MLQFQQTRVKIKESEKVNKYIDLARELKKQKNLKVTVMPIVIRALGTVLKELKKTWDSKKNWDYPDRSTILRSFWRLRKGDLPSLRLGWKKKPLIKSGVKNSQ